MMIKMKTFKIYLLVQAECHVPHPSSIFPLFHLLFQFCWLLSPSLCPWLSHSLAATNCHQNHRSHHHCSRVQPHTPNWWTVPFCKINYVHDVTKSMTWIGIHIDTKQPANPLTHPRENFMGEITREMCDSPIIWVTPPIGWGDGRLLRTNPGRQRGSPS